MEQTQPAGTGGQGKKPFIITKGQPQHRPVVNTKERQDALQKQHAKEVDDQQKAADKAEKAAEKAADKAEKP